MSEPAAMIDLHPAATRLAALLPGVGEEHLGAPTPSTDVRVAQLIEHVIGLTEAFTAAASKVQDARTTTAPSTPTGDLPAGWRESLPDALDALARAWREPTAWAGMATAGGQQMPAEVIGAVTVDELVLHGWDLAVATGQAYDPTPQDTAVVEAFTAQMCTPEHLDRRVGLFGPPLPVGATDTLFQQALKQSGRDPGWTAATL